MGQKEGGPQSGKVVVDSKEYLVFNAGITAVDDMNMYKETSFSL